MELTSILPILKKIPVFADLNEQDHKDIVARIIMNYYPAGYVFFREGESAAAGSMYILKHGMARISRRDSVDSQEKEIAVLNDNDFLGEMALVTNDPRNATATAITDCEVFELKQADFMNLMQSSPTLANKISTEFQTRIKKNEK